MLLDAAGPGGSQPCGVGKKGTEPGVGTLGQWGASPGSQASSRTQQWGRCPGLPNPPVTSTWAPVQLGS